MEKNEKKKVIVIDGERYALIPELKPSEIVALKLMEYVDNVDIEKATPQEIEVLVSIANCYKG